MINRTSRRTRWARRSVVAPVGAVASALALALVVLPGHAGAADIGGTDGNDVLVGTPAFDTIHAYAGNDAVQGGDGVDSIYGEDGDDTLDGGPAVDSVFGGPGNDGLVGGEGVDYLYGGAGGDTLDGGEGVDTLISVGDGEVDVVRGGDGYDTAWVGPEDSVVDVEQVRVNEVPPCGFGPGTPAQYLPPGCQTAPEGDVQPATDSVVTGYAFDRDYAGAIPVHLYVDGVFREARMADETSWRYSSTNFTFVHNLGTGHTFQVYAIGVNSAGQPDGQNVLLSVSSSYER